MVNHPGIIPSKRSHVPWAGRTKGLEEGWHTFDPSLQGAVSSCIPFHVLRNDPNCHFQRCEFSVVACLSNTVLFLFTKQRHAMKRPHIGLDIFLVPLCRHIIVPLVVQHTKEESLVFPEWLPNNTVLLNISKNW